MYKKCTLYGAKYLLYGVDYLYAQCKSDKMVKEEQTGK